MTASHSDRLPHGVVLRRLQTHPDARGQLTEVFRREWGGVDPAQWTMQHAGANVLRGMYLSLTSDHYYVPASGRVTVGLFDLRRASPTFGRSAMAELSSAHLTALTVPAGILRGILSRTPSVMLVGRSDDAAASDDLGCLWSDPALRLDWPVKDPVLAEADAARPPLGTLQAELARAGLR